MKTSLFKKLIAVAAITLSLNAYSIDFKVNSDWETIKKQAALENKIIFVDAYATWCGPCKQMDKFVFSDKSVSLIFDENFINYKIDMETENGYLFDELYSIEAYPTLLFITPNGDEIKRVVGSVDVQELLVIAGYVFDPENSPIAKAKKEFNTGRKDIQFLKDYLFKLRMIQENDFKAAESLLLQVDSADWAKDYELFVVLYETPFTPESDLGIVFSKHFMLFSELYGEYSIEKLYDICKLFLNKGNLQPNDFLYLTEYVTKTLDDIYLAELLLSHLVE